MTLLYCMYSLPAVEVECPKSNIFRGRANCEECRSQLQWVRTVSVARLPGLKPHCPEEWQVALYLTYQASSHQFFIVSFVCLFLKCMYAVCTYSICLFVFVCLFVLLNLLCVYQANTFTKSHSQH